MAEDPKVKLPQVPVELISLRYRAHFHLTHEEFVKTDWEDIIKDLAILDLEASVLKSYKESKEKYARISTSKSNH